MEAVWADIAVTDNSLAQCIVEIRRALDDDSQQLVRTIARRGYLLPVRVTMQVPESPRQQAVAPVEPRLVPVPLPRPRRLRRQYATFTAALILACAVGALVLVRGIPRTRRELTYTQVTNFTDSAVTPALSPDGRMLVFFR